MPQYTLNRRAILRTTGGHSFEFTPGEPINIPTMFEAEVVAMGGQRVGGPAPLFLEIQDGAFKATDAVDEREERVRTAFSQIIEKNDAREFAGGAPSLRAVAKYSGIELDRGELADYWKAFKMANESEK